jgi:hypothetical protein
LVSISRNGVQRESGLLEQGPEVRLHLEEARVRTLPSSHEDQIVSPGWDSVLVVAVGLAEEPLGPVAPNRVADPATGDKPCLALQRR